VCSSSAWILLGLLVSSAAGAEDRAVGRFVGSNWNFELGSAYAFPGDELLGDGRGILLALTNAGLNEGWLSAWKDRRWVLDHLIADSDEENAKLVVYLGFDTKGKLEGFSWYFGSGDGCGFCSNGAIVSTVKIAGGRLVGTIKGGDDDFSIDVDLDIPVQDERPGKPAAADSDPAKAFLTFQSQLAAAEYGGLWAQLDSEWQDILKDRTPEQLETFYSNLGRDKLPPEVTVREVFIDGDRALVVYSGTASYGGKVQGEARMDREDGVWKYDDGWFDAVLE
jgi:hypothetical protein